MLANLRIKKLKTSELSNLSSEFKNSCNYSHGSSIL